MRVEELGADADAISISLVELAEASPWPRPGVGPWAPSWSRLGWGGQHYEIEAQVGEIEAPRPTPREPAVRFTFWLEGNRR